MANIIAKKTDVVSDLDNYEIGVIRAVNNGVVLTISHDFGSTTIKIQLDQKNATLLANTIKAVLPNPSATAAKRQS